MWVWVGDDVGADLRVNGRCWCQYSTTMLVVWVFLCGRSWEVACSGGGRRVASGRWAAEIASVVVRVVLVVVRRAWWAVV